MSSRVTMPVTMELKSDAILGSGFSVPGGEDIAVCRDEAGYPYLKGSTLKGLLRESLENWLTWTGQDLSVANELLGESGWAGAADGRRVMLTQLTLDEPPEDSERCYGLRTFTSLENGVVKEKTLRMASCIHRGLKFSGFLTCAKEDTELISSALRGIKWVGTMRSRGFGRVSVQTGQVKEHRTAGTLKPAACIRYWLHTDAPVLITDLGHSRGNSYETRGYIPGSAIRGMVISTLAAQRPDWFAEHKLELLSDQTKFLDAVPVVRDCVPLPSIKGFYEDKEEKQFETVVKNGDFTPGLKRAKLGSFCALKGETVVYWSARTDGVTRIQRKIGAEEDTRPFQTRYLSAGQDFEGYISLQNPNLAPELSSALPETVWLGADRYEGFGKCTVTLRETAEAPSWMAQYGPQNQEQVGTVLYLLVISPLTMVNELGEPCGIDETVLASKLGVERCAISFCSTSMSEYGGYNRTWKSRSPAVRMYDRGSIFRLECSTPPAVERVLAVEREGLGIRRGEGYGQVLFLRQELFEGLTGKKSVQTEREKILSPGAELRRKRYDWIMRESGRILNMKLSSSQLGDIQALCEKAIAMGGSTEELYAYLDHNLNERGAKHGNRFEEINREVRKVLETPLEETLKVAGPDSTAERLRLLCMLFDYSRKLGNGEGN